MLETDRNWTKCFLCLGFRYTLSSNRFGSHGLGCLKHDISTFPTSHSTTPRTSPSSTVLLEAAGRMVTEGEVSGLGSEGASFSSQKKYVKSDRKRKVENGGQLELPNSFSLQRGDRDLASSGVPEKAKKRRKAKDKDKTTGKASGDPFHSDGAEIDGIHGDGHEHGQRKKLRMLQDLDDASVKVREDSSHSRGARLDNGKGGYRKRLEESHDKFGNILSASRPGKGVGPSKGRKYTLSIAVPGSVVENAQNRELKTYLVSFFFISSIWAISPPLVGKVTV
ncbi:unnamed protein product [Discosporangium mesarthrocarpum]